MLGTAQPDLVPVPIPRQVALATAAALGPVLHGVLFDLGARFWVLQPPQQLLVAAGQGPRGQQRLEGGAADRVGNGVAANVAAFAALLVDGGEQVAGRADHRRTGLHVRDVGCNRSLLADGNDLADGLGNRLGLVADVRGVDAAVLSDDLAQLDELFQRRVRAGRVRQARRQPHCAIFHCTGDERLHLLHFSRSRRAVVVAHGGDAHVAVADQGRGIRAQSVDFEPLEIVAEMSPIARQAAGHGRIERAVVRLVVAGGRSRHAAIAHDLGRNALR